MSLDNQTVLESIERVRTRDGVCSLRSLAADLGISHTGARYWVQKLARSGLIEAGESGGSIRLVGTHDRAAVTELTGTITLGVSYNPAEQPPLRIEVVGVSGACADPEPRITRKR